MREIDVPSPPRVVPSLAPRAPAGLAERFAVTADAVVDDALATSASAGEVDAAADLEAEALLGALARRVARVEPVGEPTPRPSNWLRGFATVPVRLVPA